MSISSVAAAKSSTAIVSSNSSNRDHMHQFFEAREVANDRKYAELWLTFNNFYEKVRGLCNDEERMVALLDQCKTKAARQVNRFGFTLPTNNGPKDYEDISASAPRQEPVVQSTTNTSNTNEKKRLREDQVDVVGGYQAHRQIMSKQQPPASYYEADCDRSERDNELVDVPGGKLRKDGTPRQQKRCPDLTKDNGKVFTSYGLTVHWKALSDDEKKEWAAKGKELTAEKKANKKDKSSAAAEPAEVPSKGKRKAPIEEDSESDNESSSATKKSKPAAGPPIARASSNKSSEPSTSTDVPPPARGDSTVSERALFGEEDDEDQAAPVGNESPEELVD